VLTIRLFLGQKFYFSVFKYYDANDTCSKEKALLRMVQKLII
jgi:hypothetical protein